MRAPWRYCGSLRPESIDYLRPCGFHPEESILVTTLGEAEPEMADMRTLVIIGSQQTRLIEREGSPLVYTPRSSM
ncbi:hypothetical protein HORIV_40500 [Vreelandella olivaria]|uniref:Uncharacterized protein n=1 Tax=Vreelandella olivaria TaxID=390919 RepID=A0ABM7GLG6_9GAMM|nr:hypothetical protein HORIV_40500 [Halomonas olivaria]